MKYRLLKRELASAVNWYQNKVDEYVQSRAPSHRLTYELEAYLKALQDRQQQLETNPVWKVPVAVSIVGAWYVVSITDHECYLIVDFDE